MTRPRPANPLLETGTRPAPRRVAVIGAGTIGPDIGYYLKAALPGLELVLLDVRQAAVDAALARLKGYADKAVARGKMSEKAAQATLAGLTGSTDYEVLRGCDWVIEAATEDLALKRRIFAEVEARVEPTTAITSNTSSLPAQRIFSEMAHPERATVTHFFAPAWRNPAVEVIDWPRADPALLAWLRRLFAQTGKLPLVTADAPCFMLDRVFDNWCNEAALLLGDASAAQIDSVAAEFVHAGPFFVLNLAHGNPIIIETNTLQADEEGEHYRPAPVFRSVERWNTVAPGREIEVAQPLRSRIRDRLLGVLLSQSVDILDRGIGERRRSGHRLPPRAGLPPRAAGTDALDGRRRMHARARALRARAPRHAGAAPRPGGLPAGRAPRAGRRGGRRGGDHAAPARSAECAARRADRRGAGRHPPPRGRPARWPAS